MRDPHQRSNQVLKLNLVFSSFIIISITSLPTVDSYAVSIYRQISQMSLITFSLVIFFCIFISLMSIFNGHNRVAIYSLFPVLTLTLAFPFIPQQLGYVIPFGDQMNHIGIIHEIQITGFIPETIYPAEHLLSVTLMSVSAIQAATSLGILSTISTLMLTMISLLLARSTDLPIAAPLLFIPVGASLKPITPADFTWAALFPMVILLIILMLNGGNSSKIRRLFILTIIIASSVWIWHIVPAIISTGLFILAGYTSIYRKLDSKKTNVLKILTLSSVLVGYLWMIESSLFKRLSVMLSTVFVPRELPTSSLETGSLTSVLFGEFGLSVIDVVLIALLKFGDVFFTSLMAGIGIVLYFVGGPKSTPYPYRQPRFLQILIVGAGIWSILELGVGVVPSLNFHRVLKPVIHGGLIVIGSAIYVCMYNTRQVLSNRVKLPNYQIIISILIVFIIVVSTTGVVFISYNSEFNSPNTLQANGYTLPSDHAGMNWYFERKSKSIDTTTLWRYNWRYVNYLLPPSERDAREDELNGRALDRGYRAPEHFGYTNNTFFAQSVKSTYYIEGEYDRAVHLKARPSEKFVRSDFTRMNWDPSVNHIYSNGNLNISVVG